MKGVHFVKKLSMTKKRRSSEILETIEGNFFKIFCLKINLLKILSIIFVTQIFAPPIFMTSLRRCALIRQKTAAEKGPAIIWATTDPRDIIFGLRPNLWG